MRVWTVVVAAGSGTRFGGAKQYHSLGGRRVLDWSLEAARAVSEGIVLAVAVPHVDDPEPGADVVVAGGETRSASVRAALAAIPADAEVIVVHDGARPLASTALFQAVVAAVEAGADAAVPGLPIVDTIKRTADGRVTATLDRAGLVAVQTPQAFSAARLRSAHSRAGDATDDAALVEHDGGRVTVVPGEQANVKITTVDDLTRARHLVAGG